MRTGRKTRMILALIAVIFMIGANSRAETITYTYDTLNRLTHATYGGCTAIGYTYNGVGNITNVTTTVTKPGDYNGSSTVDIADAILAMQVISAIPLQVQPEIRCTNAAGSDKIGIEDVIYVLQKAATLR